MDIRDPQEKPHSSSLSSRAGSRKPKSSTRQSTPSVYSSSHSDGSSEGTRRTSSGRITESCFDHMTKELAKAAKSHFRFLAVYDTPFPPMGSGRMEYGWKALKKLVKDAKNPSWTAALKYTSTSSKRQWTLVKFVSFQLMFMTTFEFVY